MTQFYKMPGFTLANANLSTRVLVTLFVLSTAAGLGVSLLQYKDRAELSARGADEWIRGNETDLEATEIKAEKSYRELLSITHEHAFMLPMLFFVLLHLVALCTIGEGWKIAFFLLSFGALAGTFAGMWLIAYRGPEWTILLRLSGVGMTGSIGLSCLLILYETWMAGPMHRRKHGGALGAVDPMFPKRPG